MSKIPEGKKLITSHHIRHFIFVDWRIWMLVVLLLICFGILYRQTASRLNVTLRLPIKLPIPLSDFPKEIGKWVGTDLPIRSITKEYMEQNFADDFFSRRYVNSQSNDWADVYVVYCSSRPGGVLGHRPVVCYPAAGWVWDSTDESSFVTTSGETIPCLIHRFHMPEPQYRETIILNFYILNGQITTREDDFSGLFGRVPNIGGDPARYVVQVQISSVVENSIRGMAKAIADQIINFFPNENGVIQAARLSTNTNKALK